MTNAQTPDAHRSESLSWLREAERRYAEGSYFLATSAAGIAQAYATLAGPPTTTVSTSRTGAPTT